jgi:hypothetical protein
VSKAKNAKNEQPAEERVKSRAASLEEEETELDVDDPETQARAMLEYSDELQNDPGAGGLEDDTVERRTSEDATPPPEE